MRDLRLKSLLSTSGLLLWGFLLTGLATYWSWMAISKDLEVRFISASSEIERRIRTRLTDYEHSLVHTRSFLYASGFYNQSRFHEYVLDVGIVQNYPGVLGIGWVEKVVPGEVRRKKLTGQAILPPGFKIWPAGDRDVYYPILDLEPLNPSNQLAIGYDLSVEKNRIEALERARDTGLPALSGRVSLVQDRNRAPQPGFLLYVPVYQDGQTPATLQRRREMLLGFVYSPLRSREFFNGIFESLGHSDYVSFEVYDEDEYEASKALFMHPLSPRQKGAENRPRFEAQKKFAFAGREWILEMHSLPALETQGSKQLPVTVFVGGILMSLLAAAYVSATQKRSRAEKALLAAEQEARQLLEDKVQQRTQELRLERTLLNTILENVGAGILACDSKGTITFFNRALQEMLNLPPTMVKLDIRSEVLSSFRSSMEMALKGAFVQNETRFMETLDFEKRELILNIRPFYAGGTELAGVVLVAQDVTEIRRASQELEKSNVALRAANEELEAFAYSVSHDLRAPLRGVDGFSMALIEDYSDALDETAQKYLGYIREGIQKMGYLIDDLLNLSRYSRVEMEIRDVDFTELSRSILLSLQNQEPERRVRMTVEPQLRAKGDSGLLGVLLQNLISNAWKFTSKKEDAEIEVGSFFQNGERVYFVRDNGAGFDMTYSDKLFGAFQRLHSKSDFNGTGVGLATVRRIVHRHGGRVWAQGQPQKGATFFFTLGQGAENARGIETHPPR